MNDPRGGMEDRDELIRRFATTVAGDMSLMLEGWRQLVLVSQIEAGTPDMTGFCYLHDGRAIPVSPSDFAIFDVIERLRETMARVDGREPWLAALFRIDRETGELAAQFEYRQPERWLVTPANVKARAREFAPPP
jgi:hypothetical protein